MMRYLLVISVLLTTVTAGAAVLVMSSNGTYTQKSSLYAAATDADAKGKTIVVTGAQSIASALHLHTDRALRVEPGGSIVAVGTGFANISSPTINLGTPFTTGVTVYGTAGSNNMRSSVATAADSATNSTNLNNQPASYYLNASHLSQGQISSARLPRGTVVRLAFQNFTGFRNISAATAIAAGTSAPTITQGSRKFFVGAKASNASNNIVVSGCINAASNTATVIQVAISLWRDSSLIGVALPRRYGGSPGDFIPSPTCFRFEIPATDTNSHIYSARIGNDAGTLCYLNGFPGSTYGGYLNSYMMVHELVN